MMVNLSYTTRMTKYDVLCMQNGGKKLACKIIRKDDNVYCSEMRVNLLCTSRVTKYEVPWIQNDRK